MNGSTTTIKDPSAPNEEPKKFSFDFSYWSHDNYKEKPDGYLEPTNKKYADQKTVFNDLGRGILDNAWGGYNCSLFAYGQTGSGKSYSIVGYGPNKGIVPMFCEEMFVGIEKKQSEGTKTEFEVTFSMLEIYNEQVRDLLNPSSNKKGGLKVRQHPKKGFYVESLQTVPVNSYKDIENRMDEGTRNRTVAATQMNATSSRAHTIVGIVFTQKFKNDAGAETAKSAVVNLVDLAGSERAESTGATGDRLKEGAAINQSLSTLGNCIAALADKSQGKNVRVPFRDSVLTKLLKNALGGNSKTIMIAALSPADINYEETLSTLRYADRAKQIKTAAVVNEDPTEKLIRELQEENEKLKKLMSGGGKISMSDLGGDDEDQKNMSAAEKEALRKELEDEMKAQMEENQREVELMKQSWQEKLREAQAAAAQNDQEVATKKDEVKTTPHLYNLNVDSQLSGMIVHLLKGTAFKVGNTKADPKPDIVLSGLSIQKEHALITSQGDNFFIERAASDAKLLVNGEPVTAKEELEHHDRVMFGTSHLYVFMHPKQQKANPNKYPKVVTYEMAQEEIAQNSGFDMSTDKKSDEDLLLQEDLVDMLPAVEEANAISEELDRKVKFEIVVISAKARGLTSGRTEVCVKMRNLDNGLEYIWPRDKFFRRKYMMQEMYQNYQEGEEWQLPDEKDPFTEPPDTEVHIGSVNVYLQSIAYLIDLRETLEITDYKGKEMGILEVEAIPCNNKGKELTEADDVFVEDPSELVGQPINFVMKIQAARGLLNKYTDIYCKYTMYLDTEPQRTQVVSGTSNPEFKYKKNFSYNPATSQLIEYLKDGVLMIQVWGKQKAGDKKGKKMNTKEMMMAQALSKGKDIAGNAGEKTVDANKTFFVFQIATLKKRQERLQGKIGQFKKMVEVAEKHNKARIQTEVVKVVLNAQHPKIAEAAMKKIPKDSEAGELSDAPPKSAACTIM
ncbi:kinesin-like protein KIF28 [Saccoglossus kowalevskii]|uniref:Kinesin-like protein KIF28P-like n=1 Tax=Saccoglossus kowalevskii TaxID=10224 RepID=A0ABM0M581_SACKO|nr:PREDICTED: kinesin-like protein KIF28P-like [Saccoglossus kowalevskii]